MRGKVLGRDRLHLATAYAAGDGVVRDGFFRFTDEVAARDALFPGSFRGSLCFNWHFLRLGLRFRKLGHRGIERLFDTNTHGFGLLELIHDIAKRLIRVSFANNLKKVFILNGHISYLTWLNIR